MDIFDYLIQIMIWEGKLKSYKTEIEELLKNLSYRAFFKKKPSMLWGLKILCLVLEADVLCWERDDDDLSSQIFVATSMELFLEKSWEKRSKGLFAIL